MKTKILKLIFLSPVFWLLILVIPSFYSIIRPGFFPMHDDLQAFRMHQMHKCFEDFQIPCRWIPDMGFQYGYPQFNYYPPSVYYLGEFFHLIGFQFIDSVKIVFALGFVFSALCMYIFLREYLSKWAGLVGALLYTYVPYKAVNVYVRGALNEFWALVFYPLVFFSSFKLIKEGGRRNIAFFALSIFLLLITHNLMTLIFIPVLLTWIILNIVIQKKLKNFINVFVGGILGLGLASFFTLPVFLEKQYAHLETLIGGYFDYRQHFVSFYQLFISNYWGYGSSVWGNGDTMSLSAGSIQVLASFFTLVISIIFVKKFQKLTFSVLTLTALLLVILFMTHQKSSNIWIFFEPVLIFLQFPWRFLSIGIFLLSILSAIGVFILEKLNLKIFKFRAEIIYGLVLVSSCLILYLPFFTPREWYFITDSQKFSGNSWDKQLTISIFDYLPISAKFPPTSPSPQNPETLEGLADFKSFERGSNYKRWIADVSERAILRAPVFDFPGMKVSVDGSQVPHINNDCRNQEFCLGLVTFEIEKGRHEILVKLTNTPVRVIGNLITFISFLILIILLFPRHKYFQKWLS